MLTRVLFSSAALLAFALTTNTAIRAQKPSGIDDRFANINGVRVHYLIAGKGDP